ncbi:MAG: ABC transporter ATP-binding protein [Gammaproteobacteria bacterium]|nr:ABC transporter ATP-binding protein [Gammaproteobacteria bacterium]
MSLSLAQIGVARDGQPLVQALDLRLEPGQCWALLGRNGAGKSSLLHALAGLLPYAGSASLGGEALQGGDARRLGLLLQEPEPAMAISVAEAVAAGRYPWRGAWAALDGGDRARVAAALERLGLEALRDRPLDHLSGGERRRVQLALLLAQDPAVWLLDEPMNHLDWRWQAEAECLLMGQAQAGRILFLALHDLNLGERLCSHALLLEGGGAWRAGPWGEVVTEERASALYELPLVRDVGAQGSWWHPGRRP